MQSQPFLSFTRMYKSDLRKWKKRPRRLSHGRWIGQRCRDQYRDARRPWSTILAHEIGHHVERWSLPNILEEMLGNADKGKIIGMFTKIDKSTGKPKVITDENGLKHYELNDEFRELQKAYIDKLSNTKAFDEGRLKYEIPEHFCQRAIR